MSARWRSSGVINPTHRLSNDDVDGALVSVVERDGDEATVILAESIDAIGLRTGDRTEVKRSNLTQR